EPDELARQIPDLDLLDPQMPSVERLEQIALTAEASALAIPGVTKSGGGSASAGIGAMVLLSRHAVPRAQLASAHGLPAMALAGEGLGMERDSGVASALHAGDLDDAATVGRRAGERAVKRLNPRKVETRKVPIVFDPRVAGGLIGHLSGAVNGSAIARKT